MRASLLLLACLSSLGRAFPTSSDSSSQTLSPDDDSTPSKAKDVTCPFWSQTSDTAPRESSRYMVFNFGNLKTGSTSFHSALEPFIWRPCKWEPGNKKLHVEAIDEFARSPLEGTTDFHTSLEKCDMLSDNPWFALAPTLVPTFPKAKLVLTRWAAGCHRWARSMEGLFASFHNFNDSLVMPRYHECCYGSAPFDRESYVSSCVDHERAVVRAARIHGRKLLVISNEWEDSDKVDAINAFFSDVDFSFSDNFTDVNLTSYPHVRTANKYRARQAEEGEVLPDPNADLFEHITSTSPVFDFTAGRVPRGTDAGGASGERGKGEAAHGDEAANHGSEAANHGSEATPGDEAANHGSEAAPDSEAPTGSETASPPPSSIGTPLKGSETAPIGRVPRGTDAGGASGERGKGEAAPGDEAANHGSEAAPDSEAAPGSDAASPPSSEAAPGSAANDSDAPAPDSGMGYGKVR